VRVPAASAPANPMIAAGSLIDISEIAMERVPLTLRPTSENTDVAASKTTWLIGAGR